MAESKMKFGNNKRVSKTRNGPRGATQRNQIGLTDEYMKKSRGAGDQAASHDFLNYNLNMSS